MNLSMYVDSVRNGVTQAAALADEGTQQVAARLGEAVESATRLALIQALSDAAATISADLAPTSVDLRMSGTEPQFVVTVASDAAQPRFLTPEGSEPPLDESDDEEAVARISLRLPASVKARVDELAGADGISTNAWLVRAITEALSERRHGPGRPMPPMPPSPPFAQRLFGSGGPFGPGGVFGPGGPFGERGPHHPEGHGQSQHSKPASRESGAVQGWVR